MTAGLTKILDVMAPVKTIQVRENYAPHLSEKTKGLQKVRNEAQAKAARTKEPQDWRMYRSLRNQTLTSLRSDRRNWEKEKLSSSSENSSIVISIIALF